jgi:hypothetical protein
MGDLQGRKVFKVFNQEFVVDEVGIAAEQRLHGDSRMM